MTYVEWLLSLILLMLVVIATLLNDIRVRQRDTAPSRYDKAQDEEQQRQTTASS
jgi:hypothetical protein